MQPLGGSGNSSNGWVPTNHGDQLPAFADIWRVTQQMTDLSLSFSKQSKTKNPKKIQHKIYCTNPKGFSMYSNTAYQTIYSFSIFNSSEREAGPCAVTGCAPIAEPQTVYLFSPLSLVLWYLM